MECEKVKIEKLEVRSQNLQLRSRAVDKNYQTTTNRRVLMMDTSLEIDEQVIEYQDVEALSAANSHL